MNLEEFTLIPNDTVLTAVRDAIAEQFTGIASLDQTLSFSSQQDLFAPTYDLAVCVIFDDNEMEATFQLVHTVKLNHPNLEVLIQDIIGNLVRQHYICQGKAIQAKGLPIDEHAVLELTEYMEDKDKSDFELWEDSAQFLFQDKGIGLAERLQIIGACYQLEEQQRNELAEELQEELAQEDL